MRNPDKHPDDSNTLSHDYIERVNGAIDYIMRHLDQPLQLDDVAAAACFSPYHFHRLFGALVGETLGQFIKRVRLERALYLMSHDQSRSLTEVARQCGFSSASDFSRSFKQRYGVPPSAFDLDQWRHSRRDDLQNFAGPEHAELLRKLPPGENPDGFEVTFRDLPERTVAYIRVPDPYRGTAVVDAVQRLLAWADERGLGDNQWLGYMWEDPEIVALENCRYDVAVVVDDVTPLGEIGRLVFPPMRVAQVTIRGGIDLEQRAIDWLYQTWLPNSGFVPDHQPAFESWLGRPFQHGMEHFEIEVQLPITQK